MGLRKSAKESQREYLSAVGSSWLKTDALRYDFTRYVLLALRHYGVSRAENVIVLKLTEKAYVEPTSVPGTPVSQPASKRRLPPTPGAPQPLPPLR